MENNLWHMTDFENLFTFLKNNKDKFIVLLLTYNTDNSLRCKMRKYLKSKSKIYPKVFFLYYDTNFEDIGKLPPIFNENKNQTLFPKILHMYKGTILINDVSIDGDLELLENSFKECHDSYVDGFVPSENNSIIEEQPQPEPEQYKPDPVLERKRHAEKMELLAKAQEQSMTDFLIECKKRKKKEERAKLNQQ